ncbi:MAG: glucose 1-dehydrogenase [Roseiflexaceae bacterium]
MRGLKDKVAVIAGGGSGIGAATARRLAEEGARVVIGDIKVENAAHVAQQISEAGGQAISVEFDITDDASVGRLVAAAVETYGGLDLMHANAADLSIVFQDLDAVNVPLEIFDRTIAVNLRGHLLCTRHAVPELLKRGGGSIIYTSSAAAFLGEPEQVSYSVSKSGINALMRNVASRWGRQGIRANALAPGMVLTEVAIHMPDELKHKFLSRTRGTRLGDPADIAALVAFLASDDGSWINGQVLSIDGGLLLR